MSPLTSGERRSRTRTPERTRASNWLALVQCPGAWRRRGDHMKAGFALQLVTVRWLGTFLEDPLDVPGGVLDFVAGQLDIENPALMKRYTERVKTKSDHQQKIRRKK